MFAPSRGQQKSRPFVAASPTAITRDCDTLAVGVISPVCSKGRRRAVIGGTPSPSARKVAQHLPLVIAGLVPAIPLSGYSASLIGMAGTSPAMTAERGFGLSKYEM